MNQKKWLGACIIFSMISATFADSLTFTAAVPFKTIWILSNTNLSIKYDNSNHWAAITCGCNADQYCSSYVAYWKFNNKRMVSYGPNYLKWLELYLGQSPQSPPQNADQVGEIMIRNIGNKPMPFSCDFSALGG